MRALLAGLVAAWLAQPSPVGAHPHLRVDSRLTFHVDNGHLTAIEAVWSYDQVYSARIVGMLDEDGDGLLADADFVRFADATLSGLDTVGSHLFVQAGTEGTELPAPIPSDADAMVDHSRLALVFRVGVGDLDLDASREPVVVRNYDPIFIISYRIEAAPPIRIVGPGAKTCSISVKRPGELPPVQYGASPDDPAAQAFRGMGAHFASSVVLTCRS